MSTKRSPRPASPPPPLPLEVINICRNARWFRQQKLDQERAIKNERLTLQFKQQLRAMEERARPLRRYRAVDWRVEYPEKGVRITPLPMRPGYVSPAVRGSLLYRLPLNLRERVFKYALQSGNPASIEKLTATECGHEEGRVSRVSWRCFPFLLKVSRQFEAEAGRVWYGCMVFQLKVNAVDTTPISTWIAETDASLLAEVKRFTLSLEPTCFGDLQAIVETKLENGGMQAKAQALAKMVKAGLPNAEVTVTGPTKKMRKQLHVDAKRAGFAGKGVVNGVWREWKGEVEKALGEK